MRPGKTTAVQIARIAAITLISMTVLLGSFILASSWIQARASCTPESIAAMQATLHLQKLHEKNYNSQHHGEFLKNLQPAALIQVNLFTFIIKIFSLMNFCFCGNYYSFFNHFSLLSDE